MEVKRKDGGDCSEVCSGKNLKKESDGNGSEIAAVRLERHRREKCKRWDTTW